MVAGFKEAIAYAYERRDALRLGFAALRVPPLRLASNYKTPLVEGTPRRLGSAAEAWSRARPAALKMASIIWWVLSP